MSLEVCRGRGIVEPSLSCPPELLAYKVAVVEIRPGVHVLSVSPQTDMSLRAENYLSGLEAIRPYTGIVGGLYMSERERS